MGDAARKHKGAGSLHPNAQEVASGRERVSIPGILSWLFAFANSLTGSAWTYNCFWNCYRNLRSWARPKLSHRKVCRFEQSQRANAPIVNV